MEPRAEFRSIPQHVETPRVTLESRGAWLRSAWAQVVVLLCVCLCLYWFQLGRPGLFDSEAQRVLPGWNMAQGGDRFVPHLFERPYARKPPGMPWAVALATELLGQSEFSARSVSALSATLTAMLSFFFAHRWLGSRFAFAGLTAGVAQATLPLMLAPATAAEIEMLHNFWAALAALCMVDLLVVPVATRPLRVATAVGVALGTAGMIVTKGPAALPVLGAAAMTGFVMAARHQLPGLRLRGSVAVAAFVGGACLAASVLLEMKRRIAALPPDLVVLQDPREFLWNLSRLGSIVTLPLTALASALPASIALLLVLPRKWWGGHVAHDPSLVPPIAVAWTVIVSLVLFTAAGVSNTRYTMPAMGVLGPPVAAVVMVWLASALAPQRRMRGVLVTGAISTLAVAAFIVTRISNHTRANGSGQTIAASLASALPQTDAPITVWADGAIETRAEVLHYVSELRRAQGHPITVRWWPILTKEPPAGADDWYMLRHDQEMDEWAQLGPRAGPIATSATLKGKWTFSLAPLAHGSVHAQSSRD